MQFLISIVFILGCNFLIAQNLYDNVWVFGGANQSIILDFSGGTLNISLEPMVGLKTVEANISMSDKSGSLLFYSNNCSIANANHVIMGNGDNLNPGLLQDQWCTIGGSPVNQSIISLPSPNHSNLFYVFHLDLEIFNWGLPGGSDTAPMNLYYSIVDAAESNGEGNLIEKNSILIQDTLAWSSLDAVKHANGRDWWIICPEYRTNCYYKILLDPEGLHLIDKQCTGWVWGKWGNTGGTHFSPDGGKYIRSQADNGLNIFDFDRCSGQLSNPVHISLAPDSNRISGMEISPNSRFIYVTFFDKIYQFDMWAQDIALSKTTVANYDGFVSNNNPTYFYHAKLAPDENIYICTYAPTSFLHVIDNPDSLGVSCGVIQHGISLPSTHYASVPNGPNYKLGIMPGACDTITTFTNNLDTNQDKTINLFPNPVNKELNIELHAQCSVQIRLYDIWGHLCYQKIVSTDFSTISLEGFSSGVYYFHIFSDKQLLKCGQLIINL